MKKYVSKKNYSSLGSFKIAPSKNAFSKSLSQEMHFQNCLLKKSIFIIAPSNNIFLKLLLAVLKNTFLKIVPSKKKQKKKTNWSLKNFKNYILKITFSSKLYFQNHCFKKMRFKIASLKNTFLKLLPQNLFSRLLPQKIHCSLKCSLKEIHFGNYFLKILPIN